MQTTRSLPVGGLVAHIHQAPCLLDKGETTLRAANIVTHARRP
jgi:hypothetical protein